MASFESTERHLTPEGWIIGTVVLDSGRKEISPPHNRVLTVVWIESSDGYAPAVGVAKTTWQSRDEKEVNALLTKFGPAEPSL
jgi:hypothetical protein